MCNILQHVLCGIIIYILVEDMAKEHVIFYQSTVA